MAIDDDDRYERQMAARARWIGDYDSDPVAGELAAYARVSGTRANAFEYDDVQPADQEPSEIDRTIDPW
ncbi:hypothetical protein [Streptomyces sp. NPDC000134]|uniref:hypothetical protein n=1 Tax=Streptomyces sp. NPDC000134 TaxID=3364536 RepID=UPI0036796443